MKNSNASTAINTSSTNLTISTYPNITITINVSVLRQNTNYT